MPPVKSKPLVQINKMLNRSDKGILSRSQKIPPHKLVLQKVQFINSMLDYIPT